MYGLSERLWTLWAAGKAEPQGQVLRPLMPSLLISLLTCALGLGKASWVSSWQSQLMKVGSQLSPNQRRGFLASSPIAPNLPKGTQEMQTRRGKKNPYSLEGSRAQVGPQICRHNSSYCGLYQACISSPEQPTCKGGAVFLPISQM